MNEKRNKMTRRFFGYGTNPLPTSEKPLPPPSPPLPYDEQLRSLRQETAELRERIFHLEQALSKTVSPPKRSEHVCKFEPAIDLITRKGWQECLECGATRGKS